jgi:hypothetical protein
MKNFYSIKIAVGFMDIKDMKVEDVVCCECKGRPDFAYFNSDSGNVIAIICKPCRDAFEATIKGMANTFHGPAECGECETLTK